MKKLLTFTAVLFALAVSELSNSANAADPFQPDNIPRCPLNVTRGAQGALDRFSQELALKMQQQDLKELQEYRKDQEMGVDRSVIETKKRLRESSKVYEIRSALANKTYELQSFAAKKYKCLAEIYYLAP